MTRDIFGLKLFVEASDYVRWFVEHAFVVVPAQAIVGQHLMSFHRKRTMIRRAYVRFDGIAALDMCIGLRASIRLFEVPVSPIEGNDDGLSKSGGEVGWIGRSRWLGH